MKVEERRGCTEAFTARDEIWRKSSVKLPNTDDISCSTYPLLERRLRLTWSYGLGGIACAGWLFFTWVENCCSQRLLTQRPRRRDFLSSPASQREVGSVSCSSHPHKKSERNERRQESEREALCEREALGMLVCWNVYLSLYRNPPWHRSPDLERRRTTSHATSLRNV